MTVQFVVSDLLSDAAFRLNMPAFAPGQFITDAQALRLIQNGARRLGDLLTDAFGAQYWQRTATLSTQTGLELLSLPTDFTALEALWWVDANGHARRLHRAELEHWQPNPENWGGNGLWAWHGAEPSFRLQDNAIVLAPVPNGVYTLRLEYVTGLLVAASSDIILGLPGWDEWLVLDLCEMISDRMEKDSSRFASRRMETEARLLSRANRRDLATPIQAKDVTGALEDAHHRRWWYR